MNDTDSQHSGSSDRRHRPAIRVPLIFLAAATVMILVFDLDRRFASLFFTEDGGWYLYNNRLVLGLYHCAIWPAFILAGSALLAAIAAGFIHRLRRWLRPALFLVLVMGIGPGLIVNAVFKANFGRPRPKNIQEFGRHKEFRPLFLKGRRKTGASFPSGHAAMGFYLMSPYFILLGRRRRLARLALAAGIVFGCLVGFSRICAGDHFIGDVLWSWGFVYFSGLACYYLLRLQRDPEGT